VARALVHAHVANLARLAARPGPWSIRAALGGH
jgi:hypothetical protein